MVSSIKTSRKQHVARRARIGSSCWQTLNDADAAARAANGQIDLPPAYYCRDPLGSQIQTASRSAARF